MAHRGGITIHPSTVTHHRRLGSTGPQPSSALGLGLMGMSDLYGPTDETESIATIHDALDAGVTLLDTGDFCGMGHNELLLREALRDHDRENGADQRQVRRAAWRPTAPGAASTPARTPPRTSSPRRFAGSAPTTSTSTGPAGWTRGSPIEETSAPSPSWSRPGTCGTSACSRWARRPCAARGRAPDRRPADRVLADFPRRRGRDPADGQPIVAMRVQSND